MYGLNELSELSEIIGAFTVAMYKQGSLEHPAPAINIAPKQIQNEKQFYKNNSLNNFVIITGNNIHKKRQITKYNS